MDVDPSAVTAASPGSGESTAQSNETVGKYRLDRMLGSGGMGVVWAAFDPDLERAVALKLLRAESAEQTMRTRLLREARAMARLRHPNVVTVFDVGTDKGRDYIAMELVEGGTLDDWLQTKPSREAIVDALLAAGRGLAAAHTAGLVHRDFKPHNVLRAADGHIYVTDFGLARGQIEDGPEIVTSRSDNVLDSHLTQTGVLIGTPAYMAPEQFTGAIPDPKSDQFAFCVTAWQALTGARPFRGSSVEELAASARAGTTQLTADLPAPLRSVLERGLSASPSDRWPDMPALLEALSHALHARPKRRWVLPALAGAALIAGGTVVTIALAGGGDDDDPLCGEPDVVFDLVWTAADRAKLQRHGMSALGAIAIVDETRRRWIQSYSAACAAPRTPEIEERIRCLLSVRNEVGREIDNFDGRDDNRSGMGSLVTATLRLVGCDPSAMRDFGDFGELDFEVVPRPAPTPPTPPAIPPPRPPGAW